jgi:flagellin-like hook-associated protein FlgL
LGEVFSMAGEIVLTSGVRQNLLQLQKTADLITATQTKLATGKRVNNALDNPINFFTAQGLTNRAGDLSNLLDSMSTGVNT